MEKKLYFLTGASRGLGFSIAKQLLSESIALICISRSSNYELAKAARDSNSVLEQWCCDLSESEVVCIKLIEWAALCYAQLKPGGTTWLNHQSLAVSHYQITPPKHITTFAKPKPMSRFLRNPHHC
jgi:hypothetical protein